MLSVAPDRARLPRAPVGCHTVTTSALRPANSVPALVDRVGRDRQAKAFLDVLTHPALLPVGMLRAAHGDEDVIIAPSA